MQHLVCQAVAIVWPAYDPRRSRPPVLKSYAWFIKQDNLGRTRLERIPWTDRNDSNKVDRSNSIAFNGSRAAVAFSADGNVLWTPGGGYVLETGQRMLAPAIFNDPGISALTLSRDGSAAVGIRMDGALEVYRLSDDENIAGTIQHGSLHILGISTYGGFVLFLRIPTSLSHVNGPQPLGEVRLLSVKNNESSILWKHSAVTILPFYNNAGLFSFSEREDRLVLCLPTAYLPTAQLIAFNFKTDNIANSMFIMGCPRSMMESNILCVSCCSL